MCLSVCLRTRAHPMYTAGAKGGQKIGDIGSHRAEVTGSCEVAEVGAGYLTQVFYKSSVCLQPGQKHSHGKGNPCLLPLRAGQLFLSPSRAASIPSAVLQVTLFLKFPPASLLSFWAPPTVWMSPFRLRVRSMEIPPYTYQSRCGWLPFSVSTMLCSGVNRHPSSISSILLPVTLALIY